MPFPRSQPAFSRYNRTELRLIPLNFLDIFLKSEHIDVESSIQDHKMSLCGLRSVRPNQSHGVAEMQPHVSFWGQSWTG